MNNNLNVFFTNEKVSHLPLTHSSIMTGLLGVFNPLRLNVQLHDEQYAEGLVNGFLFSTFQTSRNFIGFVRINPVSWTVITGRDFWLEEPVDQSFIVGSTPLSCIKECKSIFTKYPGSNSHGSGLVKTLDYYIDELSQQNAFSLSA